MKDSTTKKYIGVFAVVVFSALVLGGASVSAQMMGRSSIADSDDHTASEEAVARRIKPVGEVVVDPNAPAPVAVAVVATAPPGAAVPAAAAGDTAKGKSVYNTACMACHAAGVAGAPKAGDKTAWAPRLKTGKDALYASALKGKGAMPPKGGNMALPDADVKTAVDYLTGLVK